MFRATGLLIALALMWWLWSGHASVLLLSLGAASCALVLVIALRMDVVDRESTPLHLTQRGPLYWAWLFWQIMLSNIDTCKRILTPGRRVNCVVAELPAEQKTDLGKVIYANSITLTPGTLTMHLDDKQIQVHALDPSQVEALASGEMARRVTRME